jgi:RNA polymerase sigma-70 factor (sigma-E family)
MRDAAAEDADGAFTAYFSARQSWLRGTAFMLCQDWHRADDLLQTTAVQLYSRWHRLRHIESLDAYTRKILYNAFLAEQRSAWWRRVIAQPEGKDGSVEAPDPSAALDLRAALGGLPPRQRATVVLRYYDELSVQETADVLQCSTGTVKSQTARALASLRRTLDDSGEQADGPADGHATLIPIATGCGIESAEGIRP